ncbi:MAG TPA: hypothetical protein VK028_12300 [Micromonosporaceae bacterium]|nr:hypothetical protein [Micromonosporaceae bacterium]
MDISDTLAPTSDQLDAVDLLSGPRTFTIERVSKGNLEQPVQIHLAEFPRPWRPGKSMRRVLVAAWGPNAATYVGRRVTLYCDMEVKFGGDKVGGTRISHMSDLKGGKPLSVPLLISRGKSAIFTVQPLTEPAAAANAPTAEQIAQTSDRDQLKAWWKAHPALRKQIEARVAELTAAPPDADPAGEPAPGQAEAAR